MNPGTSIYRRGCTDLGTTGTVRTVRTLDSLDGLITPTSPKERDDGRRSFGGIDPMEYLADQAHDIATEKDRTAAESRLNGLETAADELMRAHVHQARATDDKAREVRVERQHARVLNTIRTVRAQIAHRPR